MLQLGGASTPWPETAVHDSVAAIMRQAAYQRSLRASLWDRVGSWVSEQIARFTAGMREIPVLRYVILTVAVAVILLVVARIFYVRRARDERQEAWRDRHGEAGADPLRAAEQAAAEGRYTDAAHALYAAVLQGLARRDRVRLHRARTSGDYARELRTRNSPSYSAFREFGRRYERIIYGDGTCDAPRFAELRALASPLIVTARAA